MSSLFTTQPYNNGDFDFRPPPDDTGSPGIPVEVSPVTPTLVPTAPIPTPTPAPVVTPGPAASSSAPVVTIVVPLPIPRAAPTSFPAPDYAGTPRYTAADYARAARALLPRGRVWPDDPASTQGRVLAAIGLTMERSDAALNGILEGSLPGALSESLAEWEATLGLPDPALGSSPTLQQRLDQVRGRFVGTSGQSRGRYIAFAAALGFTIEIVDFPPAQFKWGVRITATTGTLPSDVLLAEIEAVKPAHTTVVLVS